jgi:hypothetical protein
MMMGCAISSQSEHHQKGYMTCQAL